MNAKLLLELTGVEAGSKGCGACRWHEWVWQTCRHICTAFLTVEAGEEICTRLEGNTFPHPLRCPACLDAEEAAKGDGTRPRMAEMPRLSEED